jgi:hypothetical protein
MGHVGAGAQGRARQRAGNRATRVALSGHWAATAEAVGRVCWPPGAGRADCAELLGCCAAVPGFACGGAGLGWFGQAPSTSSERHVEHGKRREEGRREEGAREP